MKRWLAFGGAAACVLVGTCLGAGFALRETIPTWSGQAAVPGISAPIEVVRDAHAIPHVYAETEQEAQFGLGYCHAQDRLWQMELARRMGSGKLAQVFGPRALPRDRLFRVFGLRYVAERNLQSLSDDARATLQAYARGVNAYLQDSRTRLPPEFAAFGIQPEPWSALDSLVILKVMAYTLSANFSRELLRVRLARKLSPLHLAEFLEDPIALPELRTLYGSNVYDSLDATASGLLALSPARRHIHLGSNNWVVAGGRARNGRPLLANDPHLDLSAPTLWYLAHLKAPELDVRGASIPGLPTVILGRTQAAAWAFTNTESDTQDLFLEKLVADARDSYEAPGGPRAFTRRRESIPVKGSADELLEVRSSRHGPIISDVLSAARELAPEGHVLSLSWVALEERDLTFEFSLRAGRARSAPDILEAAKSFHAPQQNIVYADSAGQVGFVAAGRVPMRAPENEVKGLSPVPGWLDKYDWRGFVPFEELPQHNRAGQIVTANNDITPKGYVHWITSEWAPPFRANRISELLDQTPQHDLQSFARIQLDVRSGVASALLPFLLKVPAQDANQREVLQRMADWQGEMDANTPEPLIFSTWVRELARAVYGDELGELFPDVWGDAPEFLRRVLSDTTGHAHWCDDVTTSEHETCEQISARALVAAIGWLTQRHGGDLRSWRWGAAHRAHSKHTPFGDLPLVGAWVNIITPVSGDNETVNLAGYSLDDEEAPFASRHGPGLRALYDLSDSNAALFATSTGQSGNPLSKHYRDFSRSWAAGEYVPLRAQRQAVLQGALGTLRLVPRP